MRFKEANLLFIHIPKTGGTTITYFLSRDIYADEYEDYHKKGKSSQFILDLYNNNERRVIERSKEKAHVRACDYLDILGEDVYNNHYTFAFIRNPFEQIRSLYLQLTYMNIKQNPRFIPYKNMTFEEFILGTGKHSMKGNNSLIDQKSFIMDKEGKDIIVDDVFVFDYYKESVKMLSDKVGIKIHTGRTFRKTVHKDVLYSPEMASKVVDEYGQVYDLYKKLKKDFKKNVLSKK